MMNSKHSSAFIWIWLPGAAEPVVAAKIEMNGNRSDFIYGRSYLSNEDAIPLSATELPLMVGAQSSRSEIHFALQDSIPDAWGQRVLAQKYGRIDFTKLDLLLYSSSDRIGALHFQESPDQYQPHYEEPANLETLLEAAHYVEIGKPLPKAMDLAILHGTSVGGARPKALIGTDSKKYIAKFSSTSDFFPIVQAESAAMWLANKIGLNVASIKMVEVLSKNILLVERFDRVKTHEIWTRKMIASALTVLELSESEARYASYLDLSEKILKFGADPVKDLHELFRRIIFNILIGNIDDHAKNQAFFWNGVSYSLTPAYDLCPYPRSGFQATQAMVIGEMGSYSLLKNAITAAAWFHLSKQDAQDIIETMVEGIKMHWEEACDFAKLTQIERNQLMGSAILNPYCFYEHP